MVWGTGDRLPLIQASLSAELHEHIAANAARLGAIVHAVGGVEDHAHLAASVPPSNALSGFIRHVKGSSSHFVNHQLTLSIPFAWQPDYGVMSLDSKQLDRVVQYVKNQGKHHAQRTTIPALKRLSQEGELSKNRPASKIQPEPL